MATYLLTWNPRKFPWDKPTDSLQGHISTIAKDGGSDDTWTCRSKQPQPGDRVFLMRLGNRVKPKGIVGSGFVRSEVYEDTSWQDPGRMARYVDIRYDRLLDAEVDPILSDLLLKTDPRFAGMSTWYPIGSGVQIPERTVTALEQAWGEIVGQGHS